RTHRAQSCRASPRVDGCPSIVTLLMCSVSPALGGALRLRPGRERTPDAGTSAAADACRIFNVAMGIHLVGVADSSDRYLRTDWGGHGPSRPHAGRHAADFASAPTRGPLPGGDGGVFGRCAHHPERAT